MLGQRLYISIMKKRKITFTKRKHPDLTNQTHFHVLQNIIKLIYFYFKCLIVVCIVHTEILKSLSKMGYGGRRVKIWDHMYVLMPNIQGIKQ